MFLQDIIMLTPNSENYSLRNSTRRTRLRKVLVRLPREQLVSSGVDINATFARGQTTNDSQIAREKFANSSDQRSSGAGDYAKIELIYRSEKITGRIKIYYFS